MAEAEFDSEPLPFDDRDEAIRRAKLRLTHLEIETHRIKADLARLEACQEDDKADRLSDSLGEPKVRIAGHDSPAILRLDPEQHVGPKSVHNTAQIRATRPRVSAKVVTEPVIEREGAIIADIKAPVAPRVTAAAARRPRHPIPSPKRFSLRTSPPWLVSGMVHAAALLTLFVVTFATLRESPVFLTASAMQGDETAIPELAEFELEPVELDVSTPDELPDQVSEFNQIDLLSEEVASPLAAGDSSLAEAPIGSELLAADFGELMAGTPADGEGNGFGAGSKGGTGGSDASFFGAKSRGNRFVFVVDNSGSMVDGRMETTLIELGRSIEALKEDQLFSIIFYSDQAYPLFYPDSVDELVPATRENKMKVARWLPTVEMCLGGRLREAMDLARQMDPQVVYLLSDGDIRSEPLIRDLTTPNDWKFTVHTFGMTVRNPEHLRNLSSIATAHGGLFVPVSIHPAAAQMARQRPIKYNREAGPVWGTKVRPWN
jgi:hypothetical protein